jgi:hypothetical protein
MRSERGHCCWPLPTRSPGCAVRIQRSSCRRGCPTTTRSTTSAEKGNVVRSSTHQIAVGEDGSPTTAELAGQRRPVSLTEDAADHDSDHQDDERDAEDHHEPLARGVATLALEASRFLSHTGILTRTAAADRSGIPEAASGQPNAALCQIGRSGDGARHSPPAASLSEPGHGGTAPGALTPGVAAIGRPIRCAIGGKELCEGREWPAPARWGRFRSLKSGGLPRTLTSRGHRTSKA